MNMTLPRRVLTFVESGKANPDLRGTDIDINDFWSAHGRLEAAGLIVGSFGNSGGWALYFRVTDRALRLTDNELCAVIHARSVIEAIRRQHGRKYIS